MPCASKRPAAEERAGADEGAGREILDEVGAVNLVELFVQGEVGAKGLHGDQVVLTSGTFYNQFADVNGDWGKKGEPWHNRTEGNGWGIFQRDDTGHGIPVTSNQVWNWQENVKVALQEDDQGVLGQGELQQKRDAVDRVFDDYQTNHPNKYAQQPPPDLNVEGHMLSARDVLTMETYNGAGRIRELLVFTPANPVGVGPGKRWQWVLPPAPSQSKPYVNLVMIESNSGP